MLNQSTVNICPPTSLESLETHEGIGLIHTLDAVGLDQLAALLHQGLVNVLECHPGRQPQVDVGTGQIINVKPGSSKNAMQLCETIHVQR